MNNIRIFQNQHRHSTYTNTRVSDSVVYNEDYAKRAAELGHGIITTMEHGYQGRYIEGYELAKKYNLKFVFGAEAYWVKERERVFTEHYIDDKGKEKTREYKDGNNCHICLYALNENGRQAINDILSEANISGFYGQPRIDLELIYSLPANDVIVCTACVQFWKYDNIEEIIYGLHQHFKKHLYLEVQYHNTDKQKELNHRISRIAKSQGIQLIMGCDSHYITNDTSWERDDYLISKGMHYEDEEGWYLDYPDGDTAYQRFIDQGVLTLEEIEEAFDNTNVFLTVEEYDNPCFNTDIKMPILPENKLLTQEERDKKYQQLIWSLWILEKEKIIHKLQSMDDIRLSQYLINHEFHCTYFTYKDAEVYKLPREQKIEMVIKHYEKEIENEIDTVIVAKHADYFLMDYELIKKSVEKGGMITNTGRGSAVSFFTNKLLGFTKVDRIAAKIKMYPARFMSASRILEAGTLADIDFNIGNPEVFAETQKELFGEQCSYPMIAYGKYKASSAFKMYAKAKDVPYEIANDITSQIKQYEKDYTLAEDEDKEDIHLLDYIDDKYHQILQDSERYLGIVSSWSPHPCAHLVYQGNIRKEIGLVMMRSNQGKKNTLCCLMDGLWAEQYHFLKNDLLKVNVVKLIKLTYQDANIEEDDVSVLLEKSEYNEKVMDIYKNGYTIGINQVEQQGSRHKMMNYKAKNITELTAFVAAIRPSFKSMFKIFVNREHFDYGIKAFDNIIQTPEMKSSFILYQEMIMAALNYAGIPMGDCYTVIKCISKKRKEKIMKYKEIFVPNFTKEIVKTENKTKDEANELANQVWTIIENSARYGFNASHAYCVALDSLYGAYLKAYYPLHFYKTYLNIMNEKGDKDKISAAIGEMKKGFAIEVLPLRFRQDNRKFEIVNNKNAITCTLKSIKGIGDGLAEQLYQLKDMTFNTFTDFIIYLIDSGIMSKTIRSLVSVNYFEEFGKTKKLLDIFDNVTSGKNKYDKKHTEKTKTKRIPLLYNFEKQCEDIDLPPIEQLKAELEVFGEPKTKIPELSKYLFVVDVNTRYSPKISVITVTKNAQMIFKMYKKDFNAHPINPGEVIQLLSYNIKKDGKYVNDKYVEIDGTKVYWITNFIKRISCKEEKKKRIYTII